MSNSCCDKKSGKSICGLCKKRTVRCIVFFFALSAGGYLSLFFPFPELNAFIHRDRSTRIYDRGGNLVQILALENGIRREFTALEALPSAAVQVFLTAEDKRFFSHGGIDFSAIVRAVYQNISGGKRVSGASTVTMQLARLVVPAKERTFFTKIREAWNALRIERRLSKRHILELYLNGLPFGSQTEGVTSAARNFFGLPITELTVEQLCCLAVIPRRPASYNPLDHPETCAEKAAALYRAYVSQEGAQPTRQAEADLENRLFDAARSARRFHYPFGMPHYISYLVTRYKEGGCLPSEWYLTADSVLTEQAEFLLQAQLKQSLHARLYNGAVIVIENATGNILAWVGSNDYFDDAYNGKIDGVTVLNQSGSSSKPFLYALALEQGRMPSDIVPDIPMRFGKAQAYIPRNFNNRFNGPVRLRIALASSLNIPAVYLLNEIGIDTYLQTLERLRFRSIGSNTGEVGLSIALGSMPVSLYELVRAFSVFPRDGVLLPLRSFRDGGTADEFSEPEKVFESDTARLICSILSDTAARTKGFGFSKAFKTPFPSIFKTGTANQYQSLIALAASSAFTVGVWMGNFSGDTVMGKTGSSAPAAIARELLLRLHRQPLSDGFFVPARSFAEPEHWHLEPVCALSGMPAGPACPNTVMEYLPSAYNGHYRYEKEYGECTQHRIQNGRVVTVFPEEYRRWFLNGTRYGAIGRPDNPLAIVSPAEGSCFIDDPRYRGGSIPLEITGGTADTVRISYDNNEPFTLFRPFSGTLPLTKGNHRLIIRCGDEEKAVTFTVE